MSFKSLGSHWGWLGFDPRLVYSAASALCAATPERHDFSRQKTDGERVTKVWNDWHQHFHLSPHLQTNDSEWPAMPASGTVREATFNLGQNSYVHPARLEWYIVGARRLPGGSPVQRLNRQRTRCQCCTNKRECLLRTVPRRSNEMAKKRKKRDKTNRKPARKKKRVFS